MTVWEHLTDRLHLSPERAQAHLSGAAVRVFRDHEEVATVTDGSRELAAGETVVMQPPAVTEQT